MTTFLVSKIVAPYSKTPSTKVLGTVQANTAGMARIIAFDQFRQGWNARLIVTDEASEAIGNLVDCGARVEKKKDANGDTKSGWWQDTVFLSPDPVEAWRLLNGQ